MWTLSSSNVLNCVYIDFPSENKVFEKKVHFLGKITFKVIADGFNLIAKRFFWPMPAAKKVFYKKKLAITL